MVLPFQYLDIAEFGEPHSELSDFNIRMRYIEGHDSTISLEDKRKILSHVKVEELGSKEIRRLGNSHTLDYDVFVDICVRSLQLHEGTEKKSSEKLNSCKTDAEKVNRSIRWQSIVNSSSSKTEIKTGHKDALDNGAFCDNRRNIIICMSYDSNLCRDVFVTHLDDGTTEVKKGIVPFFSWYHPPVYDGRQYAYVMEDPYDNSGRRFGRIDLDTFTFEELEPLPNGKFAGIFNGCFHDGCVYAVDNKMELCCYNVSDGKWGCCSVKVPASNGDCHAFLLDDFDNKRHFIHVMGYGSQTGLYRIDLDKHTLNLVSSPPCACNVNCRGASLVQIDDNEFIVVAALMGGQWFCFSSKTGSWVALQKWKPSSVNYARYLVYSPRMQSFYYHINCTDTWETVQI